jgi:hypothetical protein
MGDLFTRLVVWPVRALARIPQSPERIFTEIYRNNRWQSPESRSGPGSTPGRRTEGLRLALSALVRELGCASLLDVPCGDFAWMHKVDLDIEYIGADIVADIVAANQQRYAAPRRTFVQLDLIADIPPRADLVLCRDGLVHLSNAHARRALANIKASGSTYLLATTFIGKRRNWNVVTGGWRPMNLQRPPFGLPPPISLLDDEPPHPAYRDKRLGLWRLADLPPMA